MTYSTEQRIRNSVEMLDKAAPGWRSKITTPLEPRDMANVKHCILGRVFGGYVQGLDAIRPFTNTGMWPSVYEVAFESPADAEFWNIELGFVKPLTFWQRLRKASFLPK